MKSYQSKTGSGRCLTRWDCWLTPLRTISLSPGQFVCCEAINSRVLGPAVRGALTRTSLKSGVSGPFLTCLLIPSLCPSTLSATWLGIVSLHLLQQCLFCWADTRRIKELMYFWQNNVSRSGLIYNVFYEGPVWSRRKINAIEARRQDPQGLMIQHTWFLSALSGPLSYNSAWITGMRCPFAPGSPETCDQPYMLLLPWGPTVSKTRLFSLMQFELGKLLQWHKGPPFSPAEMPAVRFNLVMNLFVREQLLFQLFTTPSLVCPAPPTVKFLFHEAKENNIFLWDSYSK